MLDDKTLDALDAAEKASPPDTLAVLSRKNLRELLDSATKLNLIQRIATNSKYSSDPTWVFLNLRGALGMNPGITHFPGLALQAENEKLRAELQGARDALVYYSARENWIKTVHGEWFTDENGECGSYARKAIKRIDESGLLK